MIVKTGLTAGQGLGDKLAGMTRILGIDQITNSYEELTGKSCGCKQRQEMLNKIQLPSVNMLINS